MSRRSLRQSIASVFQDAGLFNRTIEENIRIGCADADYDSVHAAAIAASAHDFILTKSAGYDSVVGERGAQLSGGERQRIAIARAILKNAPILVLDEATSALDVETEARVKLAIDQVRQGRTTFIIAHRLTTVRDADRIIFMDNGRSSRPAGSTSSPRATAASPRCCAPAACSTTRKSVGSPASRCRAKLPKRLFSLTT